MRHDLPDFSKLPDDDADCLRRLGGGLLGGLCLVLLVAVVYAVGEISEHFSWKTLRNGLLTFAVLLLSVAAAAVVFGLVIRSIRSLIPDIMKLRSERRVLRKAQREAQAAISEKRRLTEERARLTAQLQATYLYEKESMRGANAQATREFREALQTSVMRSCQIAFDHITRVVQQYEAVVAEIENSELPPRDKAELLRSLTRNLDVAAAEDRNSDAQKMMEGEIWKVRFRKVRVMAKDKPDAAIRYLRTLEGEARGQRLRKIRDLITSLTAETTTEAVTPPA